MQVIDFSAREKMYESQNRTNWSLSPNAETSSSRALKVKDKGVRLVGLGYRCFAADWRAVAR
jgi:hypothetical protein